MIKHERHLRRKCRKQASVFYISRVCPEGHSLPQIRNCCRAIIYAIQLRNLRTKLPSTRCTIHCNTELSWDPWWRRKPKRVGSIKEFKWTDVSYCPLYNHCQLYYSYIRLKLDSCANGTYFSEDNCYPYVGRATVSNKTRWPDCHLHEGVSVRMICSFHCKVINYKGLFTWRQEDPYIKGGSQMANQVFVWFIWLGL